MKAVNRRLLSFLRPHAWRMASAVACSMAAAVLDAYAFALLIPFLNALFGLKTLLPPNSGWLSKILGVTIGTLLDPTDKMRSLEIVILIIVATVALKNVFAWRGGTLGAQLQEYVVRDMRNAVYAHLQRLPLRYFTRTRAGQILTKVLTDTDLTKALITQIVTQGLQNSSLIIAYICFLFAISAHLTLLALVVAPAIIGALQPLLRRLRKGARRTRNDYGEMMSVVQESVSGMRLVKSFGAEPYEERRFVEASTRYSREMVKLTNHALLSQPITETLGTAVAVGLLWIGARQVLVAGTLQASQLIVFLSVVMRLLQPLKQLTQLWATATTSSAAADRVFSILDETPETVLDRGTRTVDGLRDSVVFDHVSFAYSADDPVLTDVSFTARKGDVVALVGPSGAGKSTLVDLIPRFYQPTSGRILVDGVDSLDISLRSLRALTGIVSQDTVLFNDTVKNNIAYGAEGAYSDDQIIAAARAANAHGFTTELEHGYETALGERGTRLSGGQRQRIAIARALLVDPPILILDEATSALDTESERLVQEAIDRLLAGRTVFVIAHRLSTVRHADLILVLERGRVVERGTHDVLLSARGAYYRLHAAQERDPMREGVEAAGAL
ncbi:MAG TPA: ABC transporter ATP-binding protein [Gemmatimonadaceae bacterium]|nr:ABC transporter ATP-binding protein [Gemmatimonadaceae bacterium]